MIEIFFSYSHRDEALRDELEVHLSQLKRQGLVGAWHDRRIGAGNELHGEISEHLERADVILALASPYFLDSEYCYDVELRRALERHQSGEARVIPVILEPCDWRHSPLRALRATPRDGRPVTKFPNIHDAFLEITEDIRAAAEELGRGTVEEHLSRSEAPERLETSQGRRSSNLRVKRSYSDRERDAFLDEAFEYIATYFENSLIELSERNQPIECRFKRASKDEFTAAVYADGKKRASCRVWLPGRDALGGDIAYAIGDSGRGQSMNDSMRVGEDGYRLGLRPLAMARPQRDEELLTQQGAAEYFWSILVAPLQ